MPRGHRVNRFAVLEERGEEFRGGHRQAIKTLIDALANHDVRALGAVSVRLNAPLQLQHLDVSMCVGHDCRLGPTQ